MKIVPDFKNESGLWVSQFGNSRIEISKTISGARHQRMKQRCKIGGYDQRHSPSYIGCYLSENFKDFQLFTEWHRNQVGYGINNYQLDKDILFTKNKLYGENTCVLIPRALNTFLCLHDAKRGEWPLGVHCNARRDKFYSKIFINGKPKNLGCFQTPVEAAAVYKTAKEAEARRWAKRFQDKEFIVDSRVIERMLTWTLTDDYL